MRRGRIFIYLALIIIVLVGAVWLFLRSRQTTGTPKPTGAVATPVVRYVDIITAGQNISPGTLITSDMLSSIQIPEDKLVQGLYTDKTKIEGTMYAKYTIMQGVPITESMVSAIPGNVNLPGSSWAPYIPQGMTAISIPITRLTSAAYGIRDGDYVDVIVTMLLVDVDPASQSILPNMIANLELNNNVMKITQGNVIQGHFELDSVSNQLLYVQPSEAQRARMVTQMIMQNVQVLHVGAFPLPGEAVSNQLVASGAGAPTATPVPANQQQVPVVIVKPDIVTVMVSPQDAVMLTYLIYSGIEINLTLRNPNDQEVATQPDAAMLEYLLTQYNIPVPAKLPYAVNPRLDVLKQPKLPNDAVTQP
jgi:Flp pilus assembly protein CpaB